MSKYAIYVAERPSVEWDDDVLVRRSHAFLLLVDETKDTKDKTRVIQQLHFVNRKFSEITPEVRKGITAIERLDKCEINSHLSGSPEHILHNWNKILEFAVSLKNAKNTFHYTHHRRPDSMNCRAGVKAAIESIGHTFNEDFCRAATGEKKPPGLEDRKLSAFAAQYKEKHKPPEGGLSLDTVLADNTELIKQLPQIKRMEDNLKEYGLYR
jgi:hypothetical protein